MNNGHSKIGASSMHRWAACPGSVRLSEGIQSRTSEFAAEGTAAHAVAEALITHPTKPHRTSYEVEGHTIAVTDEMLEAVKVYVDFVRELFRGNVTGALEHSFDLSSLYPGAYGTADCVAFAKDTKVLHVVDYKHGAGVAVEVENNPQLMYYALGALMTTKFPALEVEMVIVQPRCPHPAGPIRRWKIPAMDLLEFAGDLIEYAKATEAPDAPLKTGEHCRWCPAAALCPELKRLAQEKAKQEFSPTLSYDAKQLAETLHSLPIIEAWIKSVREFAYAEAEHGRCAPGWKLVAKRATRRWRDEKEAHLALGDVFDLDDSEVLDIKLKTPAAIEKLLTKDQKEALAELVVAESSGNTLAPAEDKREAIKKDAKSDFSAVE